MVAASLHMAQGLALASGTTTRSLFSVYCRYVQEAACSAVAEVLEELGRARRMDLLLPRLQVR